MTKSLWAIFSKCIWTVWAIVWCSPTNDYISIISQATSLSWSVNQAKVCPIFDTKLDGKLTQKFLLVPTAPLEKFHSDNSDADVLIIHKLIRKVMRCLKQQWAYIHLPLNRQPSRQRRKNFSWSELYAPLGKKWILSQHKQQWHAERSRVAGLNQRQRQSRWILFPAPPSKPINNIFLLAWTHKKKAKSEFFISFLFKHNRIYTKRAPLSVWWDLPKCLIT